LAFNAGNAFVTVMPKFIGFHSYVRREMDSVMPGAGRQAGNTFGRAMGQGSTAGLNQELPGLKRAAEAAGKTVQSAAERSVKARDTAANAAGKLRVAEEQLNQVRNSGKATPAQLAAAEEKVASAQRNVESTTRAAESAQKTYVDEMKKSSAAHETLRKATEDSGKSAEGASKKYASGFRGLGQRLKDQMSRGMQQATDAASKKAESGGKRASSGFVTAFKRYAAPLAGALSVGTILGKGWGRLTALDNAKAKLKGLGNSAEDVETIMANANASVAGTAFGLDAAATTAAGAVAAGIKPGQALERMLKGVANTAAAANIPMDEMGAIWNKVATTGKAQNDVLNQVADKGIPIYAALAKQMGTTADEVFNMASKGKIGFKDFEAAMTSASGTVADEMGKTVTGSMKNFMAALGRIGANLMSGVFQHLGPIIQSVTQALKPLEAGMKVVGEKIGEFLGKAVQGFQGIFEILVQGNFSGVLQEAFGIEEDHPLVNFLFNVREGIIGVSEILFKGNFSGVLREAFGIEEDHPLVNFLFSVRELFFEVVGGIKAFGAAWVYNDGEITSSGLPGFMERLGFIARQTFDFLMEHKEILVALAGAITGYKLAMMGLQIVQTVRGWIQKMAAAQWGLNVAMSANPIGLLVAAIVGLAAGFIYLWNTNEGFRNFFIGAWDAIKGAVGSAVDWIRGALSNMGEFFSSIWEGIGGSVDSSVSWLQGAMSNLGDFFSTVWQGIKDTVGGAVGFIQDVVGNVVGFFQNTVAPAFVWLYENVVKPVWEGIKLAITIALTPIVAAGMALVWFYKNVLAPAFMWLYENVVKPVWNGIRSAIGFVVAAVRGYITLWVNIFRNVLAPAFTWILNTIITPVVNGIKAGISGMWNFVKNIFTSMDRFIRTALAAAFTWFRDSVITPVWNWVKTTISNAWTAIKTVFQNAVNFIRGALSAAFTWFRDSVITPVWNGIKWLISAWWTGVKLVFSTVINYVRTTLSNVFTWFRDSVINPVWNGIKNVISNVWNKGIKPVFEKLRDFVTKTLPDAFKSGVDFIESVWKKVANVARKPINFVVDTVYNKGLRAAFNGVADAIGLKTEWRLPEAAEIPEFYAGGWTGPGHKYQEAGVVHADEFVVRKESQRSISRAVPGFLDALNRFGAKALGYAKGGLVRPVRGGAVTSGFGTSRGRYPHAGIDLAVPIGTPVFAAMDGRVSRAGTNAITGRTGIGAFLDHEGNRNTYYGHLSRLLVKVGEMVKAGQQIALSGNTGNSSGPHLHWETWTGGKAVNPAPYLNGAMLPEGGAGGGFNPLGALLGLKDKLVGKFTSTFGSDNFLAQMAGGAIGRLVTGPVDWIKEQFAKIGDFGRDVFGNVKDFVTGPDSAVQSAVRGVAAQYGWDSGRNWNALSKLISHESSWDPNAANKQSSARGLFQKMTSMHGPIESTPEGQARWGLNYIKQRYGDPEKAWTHWKRNGSYADGGHVRYVPAFARGGRANGLALVGEQGPELVNFTSTARVSPADLTAQVLAGAGLETQLAATRGLPSNQRIDAILKSIEVARTTADGRSVTNYNYNAGATGGSPKDFFETAAFESRKLARTGGR